ncbi:MULTISPECIES: four-carbon acid sugar kinase family protein [unclassified Chelatococcus]|uniref:four-carbon acid sugar kinase family protein n=1 Tax=unclassified Chelatococcus TaxID=2638111 RepID=UPI001BCEB3BE|nr:MULTISPECIES: four-carbon acid sugar kinase family protein [unclassified Chelatococcus]MBS7699901.1 hypothetical protein [Chelatococcus sp. YT9]MBX3558753.1 hypothetical protein [Chelatococcus sp.]
MMYPLSTPPSITSLRLIADDLTGALDAAAPFATPEAPVRLPLTDAGFHGDKLTLSTESRDLPEAEAMELVRRAFMRLRPGTSADTVWFKKVDSVLRGHPISETLAMAQAGRFDRCLFAPAFPDMGRITRAGYQLVQHADGSWSKTAHGDLRATFAAFVPRLAPRLVMDIPDADALADLRGAAARRRSEPGMLWAGSRGLAEALVPPQPALARPRIGLFILGTSHPATRAQATALSGLVSAVPTSGLFRPEGVAPLLLDPVPDCSSATETRASLNSALSRLEAPSDDSALLVTGGDSLSVVLARIGAAAVDCLGEISPGLPLSRISGGALDGSSLITKSGGFGSPDLLRGLLGP